MGIEPRAGILDIRPYKPGAAEAPGIAEPIKLSSNENALGCSPRAAAAFEASAKRLHLYPDGGATKLREAIAREEGLEAENIVCGCGSDELLQLMGRAYLNPGDKVVQSEYGFLVYRLVAMQSGAELVSAPERNYTTDVDALIEAAGDDAKIVFLANPNNPTGTMLPLEALKQLQDSLPEHVLFVVDGAYAEYVGPDYEAQIRDLVDRKPNTVMMRTFSKIHGLAALRLGWGYMPEAIAETYQRIRGPFNVNGLAVAAGMASIQDAEFLAKSRDHNTAWRARMCEALNAMGLATPHSDANFILPDFGSAERAAAANEFLKARNILVRAVGGYGLPERLRITVGSAEDNQAVLAALTDFTASH